jgi:hypothetical protein
MEESLSKKPHRRLAEGSSGSASATSSKCDAPSSNLSSVKKKIYACIKIHRTSYQKF